MSEGPVLSDQEAFAAEHALGVLSAAERAEAENRMAREPAFAADVEAWRRRLDPLFSSIQPVTAPQGAWERIARRLPANDNIAVVRRLKFWRGATVGSLSLAAASMMAAVMLANRPPVVIEPPAPMPILNASLSGEAGLQPLFVAAYDPVRKALIITSLVRPGSDPLHVNELWLIPSDGKPRSLGLVEPGKSKSIPMPANLLPMLAVGSALAVSVEPPGGSPGEGPTGPIAAVGKLSPI